MFKIYSKGCEYALRALTQINIDKSNDVFLIKNLCKKAKVPESSTRKIFQSLVKAGFLSAVSGPGGGYRLMKDPKDISLLSIIQVVDGGSIFDKCIMGLSQCDNVNPCPLHHTWQRVKKGMTKGMEVKTLLELMQAVHNRKKKS